VPNFASFLRITSLRYLRRCLITMEKKHQPLPETDLSPELLPISKTGTFDQSAVRTNAKVLAAVKI
jgi:hypothetical protein